MNVILPTTKIPNIYVEGFKESANFKTGIQPYKSLILGYKLNTGTASLNTPAKVVSEASARSLFGAGSMLHRMAKAYFRFSKGAPALYAIAVAEPVGAKAVASINVTGTATASGSLNTFIAGSYRSISVNSGDTDSIIAARIVSEFNKILDANFTLAVDGVDPTLVNITARHNGIYGNELNARINFLQGEANPAGIATTITAFASGTGNEDLSTIGDILGEDYYNFVAFSDPLKAVIDYLGNEMNTRATATYMQHMIGIVGKTATASDFTTFMSNINQPRIAVRANDGKIMPNFERAAYDMAFLSYTAQVKPALGTSEELIPDDLPAPAASRYSRAERESILADGGSVDKVINEQVFIDRYRTSATTEDAQETTKFDDFSFLLGQSYAVWYFQKALKQFQNAVSYDEDLPQPVNSSVPLVNTNILKAAMAQAGLELAQGAYIENLSEFKSTLQVTRVSSDRFDIVAKVNYSNSTYILALGLELVL
jgi:phage tail sheath gpL-like